MTKQPTEQTKPTQPSKKEDQSDSSLALLGMSFLVIGVALVFTDSASAAGIVFALVGFVFLASSGWKLQKSRASKK